MTDDLRLVADLVLRESGMRVQPAQYPALRSAIARAVPDGDPASFLRIAGDSAGARRAVATLIDEVTIQETSFFRDRGQLDAIAWEQLLEQARARGSHEIRVWCAACATGEEAYSLALLAREAFGGAPPVRILATDISSAALEAARTGSYRERALRGVAPGLRRRYFEGDGEPLVVGDRLRGIVHLAQHNLVTETMPPLGESAFDLIVCRNVLIYFDGETADRVIGGLQSALQPEGTLVLGATDVLCGSSRRPAEPGSTAAPTQRPAPARRPPREPRRLEAVAAESSGPPDPLDVETRFLRALGELESGEPLAAAASLRHVLYLDPTFGLAAFTLGRAHEATGDVGAARRAYQQALRTIDVTDERHDHLLEQVELADVATACRARYANLG